MENVKRPPPPPMIGRSDELQVLHNRVKTAGLTFVFAKPNHGKSFLIKHLLDELEDQFGSKISIGKADGGGSPAIFEAAIEDLYQRSIAKLSKSQQRQKLIAKLKQKWPEAFLSSIPVIKTFFDGADQNQAFENIGKDLFKALTKQNHTDQTTLRSGVSGEQARKLLNDIYSLNQNRQILVLDAFDRLSSPAEQGKLIEFWLGEFNQTDNWPAQMHIIIAIRSPADTQNESEYAAWQWAEPIVEANQAHCLELKKWAPSEQGWQRLHEYFTKQLPGIQLAISDTAHYPDLIPIPGVVNEILRSDARTLEAITQARQNCMTQTYWRIRSGLKSLEAPLAEIFCLIASLPEQINVDDWQILNKYLKIDKLQLQELHRHNILEAYRDYPNIGHTTAYDYARSLLADDFIAATADTVIFSNLRPLFSQLSFINPDSGLLANVLLVMIDAINQDALQNRQVLLVRQLILSLMSKEAVDLDLSQFNRLLTEWADCAVPIFKASVNVLAREECESQREALLQQLQPFAAQEANLGNAEIQTLVANGLVNVINNASDESRREALLQQLQTFAAQDANLGNAEIQTSAAMGLVNVINNASDESRREALLQQLQ
ncbi:MAG: hypothetical protein ACI9SP_002536, partial [Arenicella sp.]